jgi:hypothetical protein
MQLSQTDKYDVRHAIAKNWTHKSIDASLI